jgi:hypothetical protein
MLQDAVWTRDPLLDQWIGGTGSLSGGSAQLKPLHEVLSLDHEVSEVPSLGAGDLSSLRRRLLALLCRTRGSDLTRA